MLGYSEEQAQCRLEDSLGHSLESIIVRSLSVRGLMVSNDLILFCQVYVKEMLAIIFRD